MLQGRATYKYYKKATNKRPFLLSRATWAGSGQYTANWVGDNWASVGPQQAGLWDSFQGILASNLMGITLTGADIGGFQGTTTSQLITRWYQAGAFYTLMFNHHSNDDTSQEPYLFPLGADSIKQAMYKRYELLPIFFSEMMRSHFEGGAVLRHLSVEFPLDITTYQETNTFMVGSSILVIPVAVEGANSVTAYVPEGTWYNVWDLSCVTQKGKQEFTFSSILYKEPIPALLRGGIVMPLHTRALRQLTATRHTGISLLCLLDSETLTAEGDAWFDDGNDNLFGDDREDPHPNPGPTTQTVRRVSYKCGSNQDGSSVWI